MKKVFLSVLVVMLLASGIVFAADIQNDNVESYTGVSVGYGLSYEKFGFDSGATRIDKNNPILLSLNAYGFTKGASLGLYVDLNAMLLANMTSELNGHDLSTEDQAPLLFGATIGLAFREEMSRGLNLLGQVGVDFAYLDQEYRYFDDDAYKVTISHMNIGLSADLNAQFILGSGGSVAVGAKGSFMFLDFVTKETKSWTGTHDDYQSMTEHDSYIGFRVIPKLTVFKEI